MVPKLEACLLQDSIGLDELNGLDWIGDGDWIGLRERQEHNEDRMSDKQKQKYNDANTNNAKQRWYERMNE